MSSNPDRSDFNYKDYSLEKLQEWVHDAMNGDASPHEIYSAIREAVREEYYYHKDRISRASGLLELLSGHRPVKNDDSKKWGEWEEFYYPEEYKYSEVNSVNKDKILSCDKDDSSPECQGAWNDFWEQVDENHSREYNLREVEYYNKRAELDTKHSKYYYDYDRNDLNKENPFNKEKEKSSTYQESIDAGLEMTADGFWIPNKRDKVVKWQLPVEIDGASGEYYVQFPDDLMEAANLKEGDQVEWVDQGNGSYLLKKVNG